MLSRHSPLLAVLAVTALIPHHLNAAEVTSPPDLILQIELRPRPLVPIAPWAAGEKPPTAVTFQEGQPVSVTFIITNRGTEPYKYMDRNYDRSGRMFEYALEVTDAQGLRQSDPRQYGGSGGGMCQDAQLAPGGSFSKEICLNEWVLPMAPGRYTVCGFYSPGLEVPWEREVHAEVFDTSRLPSPDNWDTAV